MTHRLKKIVLISFYLFCSAKIQAQHYLHLGLWTRVQLIRDLKKGWTNSSILMWRRQDEMNDHKILSNPLMSGIQTQFSRLNKAEKLTINFAQITLMYSNQLLGKDSDYLVPRNREFRWASGLEFIQNPSERLNLKERFMQELRFLSSNNDKPVGRVRGRIVGRYELKPWVSAIGVSEIIFHDPPQLAGASPLVRFSQLWFGGGLVWRLSEHVNFETSYTFITNRRSSKVEFDDQNVFNAYLTIR